MEAIGGQELLMPVLQPKENWVKTDRINIEKEIKQNFYEKITEHSRIM